MKGACILKPKFCFGIDDPYKVHNTFCPAFRRLILEIFFKGKGTGSASKIEQIN